MKRTWSSEPGSWWTALATISGPADSCEPRSSNAAPQPSPNRAEPTTLVRSSPGAARVMKPETASAATTSARSSGRSRSTWPASRSSGTALAQPTPVTWYLSRPGAEAELVDQAMAERRASERPVARRDEHSHLGRVEVELAERGDGHVEDLLLGGRRAGLERAPERLARDAQPARRDAAAGEDRLRELVAGQAEELQKLGLAVGRRRVRDGQSAQARTAGQPAGARWGQPPRRTRLSDRTRDGTLATGPARGKRVQP